MVSYLYEGQKIDYSGFKLGDLFCFYLGDKMLYLSKITINTLTKI